MSAFEVGDILLKDGRKFKVKWEEKGKNVYLNWGGWKYIGKVNSAKETLNIAKIYLRER